jgi:hypothetical protein
MTRHHDRPRPRWSSSFWPDDEPPELDAPDLVARGPESLPLVVPHLVGFVPEHSFVVLGLEPGTNRSIVTMRFDIPAPGLTDDELLTVLDVWETSFEAVARAGAEAVTLVVYPACAGALWSDEIGLDLPYVDLVDLLEQMLLARRFEVREMVCVVGDRVRSYLCENPDCCPVEGVALDPSEALRIEASLVERGSAPLRSRQALVDVLAPRAAHDPVLAAVVHARPGAMARQSTDVVERVETFLHAVAHWGRNRDGGVRQFNRLAATAGLLVVEIPPRDLLLRELAVECDRPVLDAARAVLTEAVRCARADEAASLASVLAVCAWLYGDGAAARVALDRALAADPAYSLAHLVSAALDNGIPPWSWRESMRGLTAEAILGGGPPGHERSPA